VNIARLGGDDLFDMNKHFDDEFRQTSLADNASGAAVADSDEDEEVWEATESIVPAEDDTGTLSFNQKALQRYILFCGQQTEGGLRGMWPKVVLF
jgi:hypothetical protein